MTDQEVEQMWASQQESQERFVETTFPRPPADPGDVRFELGETQIDPETGDYDGDEERPYWLEMIDERGEVVERHSFYSSWERGNMIEAFRYCQAVPFEEEFAPFGPAWQREQAERGGRV